MFARAPESFDGFKRGTLVRMNHNFGADKISKQTLREALSHFGQLAYIDMHGKAKQITLRFASEAQMQSFLAKASKIDNVSAIESAGSNAKF